MSLVFLPCRVGIMLVLRLPDPAKGSVIMSSSCSCGVWVLGGFRDPVEGSPCIQGLGGASGLGMRRGEVKLLTLNTTA